MRNGPVTRAPGAALVVTLALLAVPGCFNPFNPVLARHGTSSKPAPLPNSAIGVVNLFQWCWQNRAYDEYQEIFTDNFRFEFASGDTAGRTYLNTPWTRTDELGTAQHLFVTGTTSQPPATSITLDYTQDLSADIDPRPGKQDTTYHLLVTAQVNLRVFLADGGYEVSGPVYFNVIRGDSAIIPLELVRRGVKPDPNRWYIERWVDGTLHAGLSATRTPLLDGALPADAALRGTGGAIERRSAADPSSRLALPAFLARGGTSVANAKPSGALPSAPIPAFVRVTWGTIKVAFR